MWKVLRPRSSGARVFFTLCLATRGSDLLLREIAALRRAVEQTQADLPFGIDAWVVLPDHLHCVWQMPAGDGACGLRWRLIKARFADGLEGAPRSPGRLRWAQKDLWQRRYWEHHIRDEADHRAHVQYCWSDPVRHGFAQRPADWPHSSIHRDIRRGSVAPDWAGPGEVGVSGGAGEWFRGEATPGRPAGGLRGFGLSVLRACGG